jgi:hypothetical protein
MDNSLQDITIKSLSKLTIDDNNNIIKFEHDTIKNENIGILNNLSQQYTFNRLNDFIRNYCLININKDAYICNKCNKNLGNIDYLYYNCDNKYIITEKYYHYIKEHDYPINELLQKLL